nr:VENN motif pre-toxin domain-containing protein [Acinetobacter higginsii]
MPEDAKTQIRDLTAAIGAVVGGTVGDSAFEAQISGVVAQNAVENNSLLGDDTRKKVNEFFNGLSSKANHPIDQGAIKGVGTVADGLLMIADAFGDTAVSAIHCPLGTSACADAMENNRQKGQAVIEFLTNLDLKEQANKIKQSYQDLNSGDPEKVANAQRTQAEVFTSLGLSATSIKKLGANNASDLKLLEKAKASEAAKQKETIKANIAESQKAREASNFNNFNQKAKEIEAYEKLKSQIDSKVAQSQRKNIKDDAQHSHGSYFNNTQEAQKVLDTFHKGEVKIVGYNKQGQPIIKYDGVKGVYATKNKEGQSFESATNYFLIKGTKKVSIVPASPKGPK